MARPLRIAFPGAVYHVTCRMVGSWRTERAWLFRDDRDRLRFLEQLGGRIEEHGIGLYVFCLMANHIHLVFATPQANCSGFMQALLTAYTVYFNRRHGRHGHLFDGRYKSKVVEADEYLLSLSRYVHLNPVRVKPWERRPHAEQVKFLRGYRWSSYPGYIGRRKPMDALMADPVLGQLPGPVKGQRARYRQYVELGLVEDDEAFDSMLRESPRSVGGDAFRAMVDRLHEELLQNSGSPEDVSYRPSTEPLEPTEVIGVLCDVLGVDAGEFRRRRRGSSLRAVAARYLMRYAGLNQREVAEVLEAGSGAAISKQLSRFAEREGGDRALGRRLKRIDRSLKELREQQARGMFRRKGRPSSTPKS